jgi:hypothetical protein
MRYRSTCQPKFSFLQQEKSSIEQYKQDDIINDAVSTTSTTNLSSEYQPRNDSPIDFHKEFILKNSTEKEKTHGHQLKSNITMQQMGKKFCIAK